MSADVDAAWADLWYAVNSNGNDDLYDLQCRVEAAIRAEAGTLDAVALVGAIANVEADEILHGQLTLDEKAERIAAEYARLAGAER